MFTAMDYKIQFIFLVMLQLSITTQCVFAQQSTGQTYTVRGEILSLVDGLPLANIKVVLKGTDYQAVSNSSGIFEIKGVPAGTYDVIAKYPDFDATILKDVVVPPTAQKSFVFNLEPADGAKPLPYIDSPAPDSLGYLEGEINVNIDAYNASLENGHLVLKAAVVGDLRFGYYYPQKWKILPVNDQNFRFKFYLPRGKSYRLYLVWQETQKAFLSDRILDVVRAPENPKAALIFNLSVQPKISGIRYAFTFRE